ncbi:YgfZ/GcvT domain-containing protein [Microbacterium aurantiacum]|uniref:CAF17-like 4Fe-4S cluster assembly/insertion protein YgfZ n=1 Tax=Microbacterium aurantiacum TaxID=162393 RepID=UPI0007DA7368|nr:glycine cleavage T C-terminal barrel domain-containing protein [Microbacterium chocolatum]ANG86262.1 aminomethyltransferase [Microbacterium chocolatum]
MAHAAPFSAVPGAVIVDDVLQHVGNPMGEQRALARGTALAPLGDRAVIAVDGEDRLTWLDSLTSQALARLAPGESTELLVLDPQGRIEHVAAVVDDGATAWLIVDRADAEGLLAWLTRMRFRLRVQPRSADAEVAVIGGSPDAISRVPPAAPAGTPLVWHDPWPAITPGGHGYASVDPHPGSERRWAEALVAIDELDRIAADAASGVVDLAGVVAADALRVAAWRPRWSGEVDERAIPHESDWMRTAVHLSKGCYRGQETVAKVHNLGHPPRRMVALQLDGSDAALPERGAVVRRDGDEVGVVTSAARHFEEGPIALAVLRRGVPVDAALTVDVEGAQIAAAQEVIVPPDAGATANVPRITRLSRRARAT